MSVINYTDGYKLDHRRQYPAETTKVYSNWTPRKSRIPGVDRVVFFGLQYFIKKYLIEEFNKDFFKRPVEEVCKGYQRRINNYLGPNTIGTDHIRSLHNLGYLPIRIKAIPEGDAVDIRVPQFTITNTHKEFFWLVNYFETLMSCILWMPCTSATIAAKYREVFEYWAEETGGDKSFIDFQGHDFSMRGMAGLEAALLSGSGHLLSFKGSDTVPAIDFLEKYYNADSDKELVSCSVAATEHAVMCVGTGFYIQEQYGGDWVYMGKAEESVFRRLITEIYPTGIVSIVSDTWNLWKVLEEFLPNMKDIILEREGKIVIRPDSGEPVKIMSGYNKDEIIVRNNKRYHNVGNVSSEKIPGKELSESEIKGVIQILFDIFGGTINTKGFIEINPKVSAIYGDSITIDRAFTICRRLAQRGFVSTCWVAGIGSYTYQYNTRDTLGFAMKATYAEAEINKNGQPLTIPIEIFKDPITDDGTKKSARGLIHLVKVPDEYGYSYYMTDQVSPEDEMKGSLETVFEDGKLVKETSLSEVRQRVSKVKLSKTLEFAM